MPTYFKATDKLLSAFNAANGFSLTADQVQFVDPRPAESVDPTKAKLYNTAVTLQIISDTAAQTGEVVLFYNRVDLAKEFASFTSLQKDFVTVFDVDDAGDILPTVNRKLGLRLTRDEIVLYPITLKNDYYTVSLEAKPNSMEYIGSVPVRLYNGTPAVIIDVLYEKTAAANALRYNWGGTYTTVETDYLNITAKTDYSPIANWLASIKSYGGNGASNVQDLDQHMLNYDGGTLATLLASVDSLPWTYSTTQQTTQLNTFRAAALFNGTVAEFNSRGRDQWLKYHSNSAWCPEGMYSGDKNYGRTADDRYERVLVLSFSWPWMASKLYRSVCFFHYNVGDANEHFLRYR